MATSPISPKFKEGKDYIVTLLTDKRFPKLVNNVPNYECAKCRFSTVRAQDMAAHLENLDHKWPYPQVDAEGNAIRGTDGGVHPSLRQKPADGGNV